MNLPNIVTFARILLIPVFVGLYFWGTPLGNFLSGVCFGIAGFTDWLDGYLARRLNQTTPFGRFIDRRVAVGVLKKYPVVAVYVRNILGPWNML